MTNITMYTSKTCPYCQNAERLLQRYGVSDIHKIYVDSDAQARTEMIEKTGKYTVPQIFINQQYIGGFTELRTLDISQKLISLLEE